MNIVNTKFNESTLNKEALADKLAWYNNWRNENLKLNMRFDDL
jgi:hypothetical protein